MLFLDTSALVFYFIDSSSVGQTDETERVKAAIAEIEIVALSTLALPEAVSAFTQLVRGGAIQASQGQDAYTRLIHNWTNAYRIPLVTEIALEASALALSRDLRGADAVQLASAARLSRETKGVRFLSFDDRLNAAANGLVKLWGE